MLKQSVSKDLADVNASVCVDEPEVLSKRDFHRKQPIFARLEALKADYSLFCEKLPRYQEAFETISLIELGFLKWLYVDLLENMNKIAVIFLAASQIKGSYLRKVAIRCLFQLGVMDDEAIVKSFAKPLLRYRHRPVHSSLGENANLLRAFKTLKFSGGYFIKRLAWALENITLDEIRDRGEAIDLPLKEGRRRLPQARFLHALFRTGYWLGKLFLAAVLGTYDFLQRVNMEMRLGADE